MIPSEGQLEQFREAGFFLTERMFDDGLLDRIAVDFERLRAEQDAAIRESGERDGISLEGRNFIFTVDEKSAAERVLGITHFQSNDGNLQALKKLLEA